MKQIPMGDTYYDSPEKGDAQTWEYRGFIIEWDRPPIPPSSNCDWAAWRDGYEENGCFHSSRIADLEAEINEYWECEAEEKADALKYRNWEGTS